MKERGNRRVIDGVVVSDKMDKTVVVRAERVVRDPRYEKYVRRYSRFMAHDEENACGVGDRVRIVEPRPISKRKRWKVQNTLGKATTALANACIDTYCSYMTTSPNTNDTIVTFNTNDTAKTINILNELG